MNTIETNQKDNQSVNIDSAIEWIKDQIECSDKEQAENLMSDKTSATSSNGSQDSPKNHNILKFQDPASIFICVDFDEFISQTNNEQTSENEQKQLPLYKQIVLSGKTQDACTISNQNSSKHLQSAPQFPTLDMVDTISDQFQNTYIKLSQVQEEQWDVQMSEIVDQIKNQLAMEFKGLSCDQKEQEEILDMGFAQFLNSIDTTKTQQTNSSNYTIKKEIEQSREVLNDLLFGDESDDKKEIFNFEKKNESIESEQIMTMQDLSDFICQVNTESAHSDDTNEISQKDQNQKQSQSLNRKFYMESACFEIPSSKDVPEDLFD